MVGLGDSSVATKTSLTTGWVTLAAVEAHFTLPGQASTQQAAARLGGALSPAAFEDLARSVLGLSAAEIEALAATVLQVCQEGQGL